MKQKVGPAAIVIAVIALVVFLFFYGKRTLGPRQEDVSPDNAPAYAKEMMKNGTANPYINSQPPK